MRCGQHLLGRLLHRVPYLRLERIETICGEQPLLDKLPGKDIDRIALQPLIEFARPTVGRGVGA